MYIMKIIWIIFSQGWLNSQITCKNMYSHQCVLVMKDSLEHSNIYNNSKKIHQTHHFYHKISLMSIFLLNYLASTNSSEKLDKVSDNQKELVKIIMCLHLPQVKPRNKLNLLLKIVFLD